MGTTDNLVVEAVAAIKDGKIPLLKSDIKDWSYYDGLLFFKGKLYIPDNLDLRQEIV